MKLGIIFTCKNLLETTKAAYESIQTTVPYHVIFISDYSNDGTEAWLEQLAKTTANVVFECYPMENSLAGKWNLGIKMAMDVGCDTFLICNNDILFHPQTIDNLVSRFNQGDVVLASAHNIRDQVTPEQFGEFIQVPQNPTEAPHPDFSCFLINDRTLDLVGWFDTGFSPCYFEDNDYHYRIKQVGLHAIATTSAPYYHYGSMTQNSVPGGLCKGEKFVKNREYFVKKHGVDPATYERV